MTYSHFVTYVLDQIKPLGTIQTKSFFSSLILFVDDIKFGLINCEKMYFQVNDTTRPKYEGLNVTHYQPRPNF